MKKPTLSTKLDTKAPFATPVQTPSGSTTTIVNTPKSNKRKASTKEPFAKKNRDYLRIESKHLYFDLKNACWT